MVLYHLTNIVFKYIFFHLIVAMKKMPLCVENPSQHLVIFLIELI